MTTTNQTSYPLCWPDSWPRSKSRTYSRFRGYMAIPERTGNNWWVALGVAINATLEQAEAAYRSKAKEAHPDTSSSTEAMAALNLAIAEARKNLGATQ